MKTIQKFPQNEVHEEPQEFPNAFTRMSSPFVNDLK